MSEALAIAERYGAWAALAAVLVWTILRERTADRGELREVKGAHLADLRLLLPALQASTDAAHATREAADEQRKALDVLADRVAAMERDIERFHGLDRTSTDPGPPPSRRAPR